MMNDSTKGSKGMITVQCSPSGGGSLFVTTPTMSWNHAEATSKGADTADKSEQLLSQIANLGL